MEKRSREEVEGLMKKMGIVSVRTNGASLDILYEDLKDIEELRKKRDDYTRRVLK